MVRICVLIGAARVNPFSSLDFCRYTQIYQIIFLDFIYFNIPLLKYYILRIQEQCKYMHWWRWMQDGHTYASFIYMYIYIFILANRKSNVLSLLLDSLSDVIVQLAHRSLSRLFHYFFALLDYFRFLFDDSNEHSRGWVDNGQSSGSNKSESQILIFILLKLIYE